MHFLVKTNLCHISTLSWVIGELHKQQEALIVVGRQLDQGIKLMTFFFVFFFHQNDLESFYLNFWIGERFLFSGRLKLLINKQMVAFAEWCFFYPHKVRRCLKRNVPRMRKVWLGGEVLNNFYIIVKLWKGYISCCP